MTSTCIAHRQSSNDDKENQPLNNAITAETFGANLSRVGQKENSLETPSHSRPATVTENLTPLSNLGSRRRVLRYGETEAELFCLGDTSTEEHRRLSRSIASGDLANDIASWRQVLECASSTVDGRNENFSTGQDLIRLHRRATSRFPLYSKYDASDRNNILAMWLSYARTQTRYGSRDEARLTFRHIQNKRLGIASAAFYIALADFERTDDPRIARDVLMLGVKNTAEPENVLKRALADLDHGTWNVDSYLGKMERTALRTSAQAEKSNSPRYARGVRPVIPPLRSQSAVQFSRKRSITSQQSPLLKKSKLDVSDSIESRESLCGNETERLVKESMPRKKQSPLTRHSPQASKFNARLKTKTSLFSRTSSLSRMGLSGVPKRVDPYQSQGEDGNTQDSRGSGSSIDQEASSEFLFPSNASAVPKISKMDLSYMLNWDPERSRPKTGASKLIKKDESPPKTEAPPPLTKIDEIPSNSVSSKANEQSSTKRRQNTEIAAEKKKTSGIKRSTVKNSILESGEEKEQNHCSHKHTDPFALTSTANNDFLPLVCEKNMLKVNGIPYAKLGVIGKGASCKVYRALSKDFSVVAIKKVKLGGVDRRTIDGYANEISLLKKLRGTPAIIQMSDSQVDLSRKAIFLVMELGEVDLNHVLQKQNNHQDEPSPGKSSLSIHFIRLTWQQMLGAVHSIHEERIIHGDLKPANFLFVRGALKLIDFGIAKAIQSDDTTNIYRDNQTGTLNYMSPEAILDTGSDRKGARHKLGRASDIWSLGCILYQMVYGRTPFAELRMIQKLQAITDSNYKIKFPYAEDEAAVDAMQLCLRRDPDTRPPIVGCNGLLNEHRFLHSSNSS